MRLARFLAVVLTMAFPIASLAQLQWRVVPGTWSGGVELGFDRSQQSTATATSSSGTTSQKLRESVRLSNNNFYVLDPRLLTGSLGLQLNLAQRHANGTTLDSSEKDRATGYDLNLTALAQKPYVGNFFANRTHTASNQAFGGVVDGTRETRGIRLELHEDSILKDKGFPWFKAELTAQQDHALNTTTFFERVTQLEERNKQVNFIAQKGFTTADLSMRYFSLNDTQNTSVIHSVDFGSGLNNALNSSLTVGKRSGEKPVSTTDLSEDLNLVHSRSLSSNYTYVLNRQLVGDEASRKHTARIGLTHELYTNLTTNVSAEGSQLVVSDGKVTTTNTNFSQVYQHSLPGKGAINVNWSGGYGQTTNDLVTGQIHVLAESYSVPNPFVVGILYELKKANPILGSVEVFNVKNGGQVKLAEGIDYNLIVVGNRIRLELILQTPAGLFDVGDPLEISYDYQLDPKLKYETRSLGFGVAVNYGWIMSSYQHQQSDNNLLEGQGFLVNSLRSDSVGVTLNQRMYDLPTSLTVQHTQQTDTPLNGDPALVSNTRIDSALYRIDGMMLWDVQTSAVASHSRSNKLQDLDTIRETQTELEASGLWHEFSGQAKVTFNEYQSNRLGYQRRSLASSLNWQVDYNLSVVASVNASDIRYTSSSQHDSTRSARTAARWATEDGWRNEVFAELRFHDDGRATPETIIQLGGRAYLLIGKLSLSSGASYDRWVRGSTRSSGLRFDVSALRSF